MSESNKHEGTKRGFYHFQGAFYRQWGLPDGVRDQVMFGYYGSGTSGEMAMRWIELGGRVVPRLEVYDDAWDALATFTELLRVMALSDGQNITPATFCSLLLSCGFEDMTQRTNLDAPRDREAALRIKWQTSGSDETFEAWLIGEVLKARGER